MELKKILNKIKFKNVKSLNYKETKLIRNLRNEKKLEKICLHHMLFLKKSI